MYKLYAETNVNLVSGGFTESVDDFDIELNTMDLTFTRTYNSADSSQSSILGIGWTTNYEAGLYVLPSII